MQGGKPGGDSALFCPTNTRDSIDPSGVTSVLHKTVQVVSPPFDKVTRGVRQQRPRARRIPESIAARKLSTTALGGDAGSTNCGTFVPMAGSLGSTNSQAESASRTQEVLISDLNKARKDRSDSSGRERQNGHVDPYRESAWIFYRSCEIGSVETKVPQMQTLASDQVGVLTSALPLSCRARHPRYRYC